MVSDDEAFSKGKKRPHEEQSEDVAGEMQKMLECFGGMRLYFKQQDTAHSHILYMIELV